MDDLHAKGRYFVLCALKRRLRAAVLASSRKALRYRKPHAAGEIARPTKPRKRAVTQKAAAICQSRQRADDFIGPYAGGGVAGRCGKPPDAGAPSAVPGYAAHLPCNVGRARSPAGGGSPEGYWQGKAPHPSVG